MFMVPASVLFQRFLQVRNLQQLSSIQRDHARSTARRFAPPGRRGSQKAVEELIHAVLLATLRQTHFGRQRK
jgi:hypothetical protein